IPADRAVVRRSIEQMERRRAEEEQRRRESPDRFLSFRGKGLGIREIRRLFREYPGLVCLGQEYQILADSVRTTKWDGILVSVEWDWPMGRHRARARDVGTKLNDGVIMLDSERGIWVWHDPHCTDGWHEIPGGCCAVHGV